MDRAYAFDGQVARTFRVNAYLCWRGGSTPRQQQDESGLICLLFCQVVDYPELKGLPLNLLHQYRVIIAMSGEPLGVAATTQHKIKVKSNTKPVYIPATRIPHSQGQIVDEQFKDKLYQGVIQLSDLHGTRPCS